VNPLLDFGGLPRFPEFRPEHVAPALDALLAEGRATVAAVTQAAATWDAFIVPLDDVPGAAAKRPGLLNQFLSWISVDDGSGKATMRYRNFPEKSVQLKDRVQQVQAGLHNVGLNSRRLPTQDLIELFYQIYNPKSSQEQKMKGMEAKAARMVL